MTCSEQFLEYKVGDTQPDVVCTYTQTDPNDPDAKIPVDITGFTFRLDINYNVPASVLGTIVSALDGEFKFEYTVGSSEISEVGKFTTEIVITDASGKQITYDFIKFDIKDRIVP